MNLHLDICVVGGQRPSPLPQGVRMAVAGVAVAGLAAQLGCQRLWIMFLAYAAVWWLCNALQRLHSVSKLLKSHSSQAFLLSSCCSVAWMSRAANVLISLNVFVLLFLSIVLCSCALFLLFLHLTCRPRCQLSSYNTNTRPDHSDATWATWPFRCNRPCIHLTTNSHSHPQGGGGDSTPTHREGRGQPPVSCSLPGFFGEGGGGSARGTYIYIYSII